MRGKAFFLTMGSRMKEDERTEKAIRSLLKLPENRRCINCNSLGPQYVCSTFWTFVCINCSGIHREFTHRVKSISMAKFTAEEVNALRAGGNERAKQIYFKEWDTHRDGYPDGSNIFKLRDFIRSVYVDQKYTSENHKSSQLKLAVIEDHKGSKKASTSLFGSRSFHSLDKSEIERASAGGGRSGSESLKFYFDDHKKHVPPIPKSRVLPKSPIRFEIVDDRFRDDGSVKRYDMRRDSRGNSKSLDLSNNKDTSSLRIGSVVKVEKNKDLVISKMSSSSDKLENLGSLIDDVPPVSEPRKTIEYPAPNSLEALLFGLSAPSIFSETNNYVDNIHEANLGTQEMPETPNSTVTVSHSSEPTLPVNDDNLSTKDLVASPSVASNNQVESSTPHKEPLGTSMEQSTLDINSSSPHEVQCEPPHQDETKSSIRNAFPEDLFTGGFSLASPQVHVQNHGIGYGMQYYQYPVTTYTSKSSNPFDISFDDHTSANQAPQFPSMAYTQGGGLPQVSAPNGFSDSSSMSADYIGLGLMASQSPSYATTLSPTSPSLGSNTPQSAYIGQHPHANMLQSFGSQELNDLNDVTFNTAHSFHQATNGYPSTNSIAYMSRGNPFE